MLSLIPGEAGIKSVCAQHFGARYCNSHFCTWVQIPGRELEAHSSNLINYIAGKIVFIITLLKTLRFDVKPIAIVGRECNITRITNSSPAEY